MRLEPLDVRGRDLDDASHLHLRFGRRRGWSCSRADLPDLREASIFALGGDVDGDVPDLPFRRDHRRQRQTLETDSHTHTHNLFLMLGLLLLLPPLPLTLPDIKIQHRGCAHACCAAVSGRGATTPPNHVAKPGHGSTRRPNNGRGAGETGANFFVFFLAVPRRYGVRTLFRPCWAASISCGPTSACERRNRRAETDVWPTWSGGETLERRTCKRSTESNTTAQEVEHKAVAHWRQLKPNMVLTTANSKGTTESRRLGKTMRPTRSRQQSVCGPRPPSLQGSQSSPLQRFSRHSSAFVNMRTMRTVRKVQPSHAQAKPDRHRSEVGKVPQLGQYRGKFVHSGRFGQLYRVWLLSLRSRHPPTSENNTYSAPNPQNARNPRPWTSDGLEIAPPSTLWVLPPPLSPRHLPNCLFPWAPDRQHAMPVYFKSNCKHLLREGSPGTYRNKHNKWPWHVMNSLRRDS